MAREGLRWPLIWERYHPWAGVLVSGMLIAVCYGFVLRLPFFYDDPPILLWLRGSDLVEIWTGSTENGYYRPLSFTVYKLGQAFPLGAQQVVLHGTSVLVHWLSAILVMQVSRVLPRTRSGPLRAVIAASLYAVFPFLYRAVPWVTSLPHLLAALLTLFAVYATLRAVRGRKATWWALGVTAIALAPFAHESGFACAAIVGGIVFIECGIRDRRWVPWIVAGGLFNVGALLLRTFISGAGAFHADGLNSWVENATFCLQGLVYPVGKISGWLVRDYGWHDLTVVQAVAGAFAGLLIWLVVRTRSWRWVVRALWWWGWGLLPAALAFRFQGLVESPRFYALSAGGIVLLWAEVIVELGKLVRPGWMRRLAWGLLAGAVVGSSSAYLLRQQHLHLMLFGAYNQILDAAQDERNEPLGFVNVPGWLAPRAQAYPLSKDGVMAVPFYSDVWQFIAANQAERRVDNVMFVHTLEELDGYWFGFHGDWPDWGEMRQFAATHRSVWLVQYESERLTLNNVGSLRVGESLCLEHPLVRFENGPVIEAVSVQESTAGQWAITLDWCANNPIDADVFVHVIDSNGTLAKQADGAALGRMLPMSLWQPGDRIHDIRHVDVPIQGEPYTVLVGVYTGHARVPAYMEGVRAHDDAAPVAVLGR